MHTAGQEELSSVPTPVSVPAHTPEAGATAAPLAPLSAPVATPAAASTAEAVPVQNLGSPLKRSFLGFPGIQ